VQPDHGSMWSYRSAEAPVNLADVPFDVIPPLVARWMTLHVAGTIRYRRLGVESRRAQWVSHSRVPV
jgi:hypothetical protein